jgi:hypothetical protein
MIVAVVPALAVIRSSTTNHREVKTAVFAASAMATSSGELRCGGSAEAPPCGIVSPHHVAVEACDDRRQWDGRMLDLPT